MKIIQLDPHQSTYLIEDDGKHYRLQRWKEGDSDSRLVISELDENNLDSAISNCMIKML